MTRTPFHTPVELPSRHVGPPRFIILAIECTTDLQQVIASYLA